MIIHIKAWFSLVSASTVLSLPPILWNGIFLPPLINPLICGNNCLCEPALAVVKAAVNLAYRIGFRIAGGAALCTGLNPCKLLSLIGVEVRNLLGWDSLAKNMAVFPPFEVPLLPVDGGVESSVNGCFKSAVGHLEKGAIFTLNQLLAV